LKSEDVIMDIVKLKRIII